VPAEDVIKKGPLPLASVGIGVGADDETADLDDADDAIPVEDLEEDGDDEEDVLIEDASELGEDDMGEVVVDGVESDEEER
jgi:midasin (ATPase involved in ribosome maturation)